jgi:acyl-coenzyme A synthetase/AMP-(fatty) acid ligase
MTAIPFDRTELEQGIVARFAKVAAQHASQTAICGNGEECTYEELERRTNQVARAILDRASPGFGCIAYLVNHSPNMVICALAALKAGKAFLCLYPAMPLTARRDIIRDAAPELLLTDVSHETVARGLAGNDLPIIRLAEIDARYSGDALRLTITPNDPAAIFYTSGSTGRPKGVVKSHRAVLHRAWLCAQYDSINTKDRQSLLTYLSFASTLEGSGLHPSVRLLALAGDRVVASDIQQWRHRFATSCALRHRFSSTEAGHIAVACVEPGPMPMPGVVPAPHPVADKFLSVIDAQGSAVKIRESGELVVRSAFLADGYWRRAKESADQFQIAPNHPNERLFRTGDMVRLLADGGVEFLSRRDDQVKIRGYRVETREIELAFLTLPGVKEAAVMAESRVEANSLVSFVVMKQGASFQANALRSGLRLILPQWKIPAYIYPMKSLPLTLTGKIDRQLLQEYSRARASASNDCQFGSSRDGGKFIIG